jgi:phage terminase small subunit
MAGLPGRSGGARPGAGRPRKTMVLDDPSMAGQSTAPDIKPGTPAAYLLSVVHDVAAEPKMRIDAAKALLPYMHARCGEAVMSKAAASDKAALDAHKGTDWATLLQ